MAGLSEDKIAMLKGLVAASPDEVVRSLERAVGNSGGSSGPLAAIGALVEAEAADRAVRFQTLAPLVTLFGPRSNDSRPTFPRAALNALWRALKSDRPEWVKQAAEACYYIDPEEPHPSIFDALCTRAAVGLKAEAPDYAPVVKIVEADRPGSSRQLILALEIAPIVRPPLLVMTEWLQRMTDQRRATARLAYRDAAAVGDGGGPLMFEMLASHLKHPTQILRVLSAIMDHPGERYLAESELAMFGERVIGIIEGNLERVRTLRPGAGPETARDAAEAARRAIEEMAEFEQSIQLSREGPWGQRLSRLKHGLAAAVEMRLKEIEEAVAFALPVEKKRYSGRLVSITPKLDDAPDEGAIGWAIGLLTFAEAVRSFATEGGFGGTHAKMVDTVGRRIDQYVDDVLEQMRLGDLTDDDRAREYLDVAAAMLTLIRDKKAAGLIRRRAAAA